MRRMLGHVTAIRLEPDGSTVAKLQCPPPAIPHAGQFSLAVRPGEAAPLRTAIFPRELHEDGFTAIADASWQPGDALDLLGPVGRGFRPFPNARRWAAVGVGRPLDRLMPLIQRGLQIGANVAVWSPRPAPGLPPQVEVVQDAADALTWADYIALDVLPELLGGLGLWLDAPPIMTAGAVIQALITPAMPCGLGVCQACAITGRTGKQLACLDGPVFDWPLTIRKST